MPRNKIKAKFYNICALIGKPIEILIFVENSKKKSIPWQNKNFALSFTAWWHMNSCKTNYFNMQGYVLYMRLLHINIFNVIMSTYTLPIFADNWFLYEWIYCTQGSIWRSIGNTIMSTCECHNNYRYVDMQSMRYYYQHAIYMYVKMHDNYTCR